MRAIACFLLILSPAFSAIADQPSIMQGMTTETTTQISIVSRNSDSFSYRLVVKGSRQSPIMPDRQYRNTRPESEWGVDQVSFSALEKGKTYQLQVIYKDRYRDVRELTTLDLGRNEARIAFASCMSDFFWEFQEKMWDSLISLRPDMIFFTGDNVYASMRDPVTPEQLWKRYIETRRTLKIFYSHKLIPILATWDDHDYGADDGESTYTYKAEAKAIFDSFYSQAEVPGVLTPGPGVSSHVHAFGQNFLLMDDRTYQSQKGAEKQTLWGTEQEDWMMRILQSATEPAWIVNGSQVFGKYNGSDNSYEADQPESFESLIPRLATTPVPIIFASGDVHYSEIMKLDSTFLGYTTYEITSSSMHSFRSPFAWLPSNPRRIAGVRTDNFIVTDIVAHPGRLDLRATSYGPDAKLYFTSDLTVAKP